MRILAAVCCALLLSSCAMLGGGSKKSTATTQYSPIVPVVASPAGRSSPRQLVVDVTFVDPALNNLRIAVRPTGHELEVYKDVRWANTPSEMLTTHLLETFERMNAFRTVTRSGAGLAPDLRLGLEIRQFESVYSSGGVPSATIVVVAKLIDSGAEREIQSREFTASVPSSDVSVPSVVDAFASAMSRIDADIAAWTVATAH